MKPDNILIIGAGPAGITAAIQLKRYGIPFLLLENERVGGLLWNANLVENYPGFPAGVSGPRLVSLIEKQIQRLGVEVVLDTVKKVRRTETGFYVKTLQTEYNPRYVIIASGTRPKLPPIFVPDAIRKRVFSGIYHLLDEADKDIIIIGAGDAAFDYALNLTKNRNSVTILNRGRDVKCLRVLWERARAEPLIKYRTENAVRKIESNDADGRLRVQTETSGSLEADYLIFATGRVPQASFLPDELTKNSPDGLYFAGDVKNGMYRQAAIAAGDGLRAAMEIYHNLNSEASSI